MSGEQEKIMAQPQGERDETASPETRRRHHSSNSHKADPSKHATDETGNHHEKHAGLCAHRIERRLFDAVHSLRHPASAADKTSHSRHVRISDKSEEIIQFRRLQLPSSDSYDGSAEGSAPALVRLQTDSTLQSRNSDAGLWFTSDGWNALKLLSLTDVVRAALASGRRPTASELVDLNFVLEMMLVDELEDEVQPTSPARTTQKVAFSMIQRARLDKLLADMLKSHDKEQTAHPETDLGFDLETTISLQKQWRSRFKSEYFAIDKYRTDDLMSGALRNVTFSATPSDGLGVWVPDKNAGSSGTEYIQELTPGHWWINMGCAHRDGIVSATRERASKGRCGIAVLALLTGTEEDMPDGKSVYIREGEAHKMHNNLISRVGQKIRILRGFRLKSMCGPKAGVRYDGLYTIQSWSIKLNPVTEVYTQRLVLERVLGQRPSMEDIVHIPKPSQLDDWHLYEMLERDKIRETGGQVELDKWIAAQDAERIEREQWRRNQEFRMNLKDATDESVPVKSGQNSASRGKAALIDTDLLPHPEIPEEEAEK